MTKIGIRKGSKGLPQQGLRKHLFPGLELQWQKGTNFWPPWKPSPRCKFRSDVSSNRRFLPPGLSLGGTPVGAKAFESGTRILGLEQIGSYKKGTKKRLQPKRKTLVLAGASNENCGPGRGAKCGHRKCTFWDPRIQKGVQRQWTLRQRSQEMTPTGSKRCELLEASGKIDPPR